MSDNYFVVPGHEVDGDDHANEWYVMETRGHLSGVKWKHPMLVEVFTDKAEAEACCDLANAWNDDPYDDPRDTLPGCPDDQRDERMLDE